VIVFGSYVITTGNGEGQLDENSLDKGSSSGSSLEMPIFVLMKNEVTVGEKRL
jgi:hypothetical protein